MILKGYKAFNNDLTNRYGKQFEVNKIYTVQGDIKFGTSGNGFHFCERLEDTLRYVNGMEEDIQIAEITAYQDFVEYSDEYYGYYNMYAARTIKIDEVLERKKIIETYLEISNEGRVIRFIQGFRLTKDEIELFKLKYCDSIRILNAIAYYQEDDKDIYSKENKKIYSKKVI